MVATNLGSVETLEVVEFGITKVLHVTCTQNRYGRIQLVCMFGCKQLALGEHISKGYFGSATAS